MEFLIIALKWLSQGLVVVVGIWGLLSDPFTIGADGKRKLTRTGWTKVILLGIGLVLFVATDVQERAQAAATNARQAQLLAIQETQLGYSRELLLTQHSLSEVVVELDLAPKTWQRFEEKIVGYTSAVGTLQANATTLAYAARALLLGSAVARLGSNGEGYLEYSLYRGMGTIHGRFAAGTAEWDAFVSAFQSIFGRRFEIRNEAGRVIIDLLNPNHQMSISTREGKLLLVIRSPGVRFDELRGAVSIVLGLNEDLYEEGVDEANPDSDEPRIVELRRSVGPDQFSIISKDPRVAWDQHFKPRWKRVPLRRFENPDRTTTQQTGEWHAGPYRVEAQLDETAPGS